MAAECRWTERVYRKKEEIVSRQIAGEMILVPIRSKFADMQRIFSLNPVADFIWGLIDGKTTTGAILSALLDRYDTESEKTETDMKDFLSELLKAGLIEDVE